MDIQTKKQSEQHRNGQGHQVQTCGQKIHIKTRNWLQWDLLTCMQIWIRSSITLPCSSLRTGNNSVRHSHSLSEQYTGGRDIYGASARIQSWGQDQDSMQTRKEFAWTEASSESMEWNSHEEVDGNEISTSRNHACTRSHAMGMFLSRYLTYVDDGMIFGSDQEVFKEQLRKLKKGFKLTIQPLNKFLIESSTWNPYSNSSRTINMHIKIILLKCFLAKLGAQCT